MGYGDLQSARVLPVRFTGRGGEYFRIWIVNVALSILTVGIYSAWAKVRSKRYFYGSTRLDGASFDYTASPVAILKGRVLVVGFFVIYGLVSNILPTVEPVMGLALVLLLPWAAVRSLAFNARYSGFRAVAFRFRGEYAHAFVIYVLMPLGSLFTFGLLYPYTVYARKRFVVEKSGYGDTPFTFDGTPGAFYAAYALGSLVAIAGAAVAVALGALAAAVLGAAGVRGMAPGVFEVVPLVGALGLMAAAVMVQVRVGNYTWCSTTLRGNRFDLRQAFWPLFGIQLSNLVLIVLSVGLFIPFAKVRLARYRLERLSLRAEESLADFAAGARERLGALGDELGDALDLDLGL